MDYTITLTEVEKKAMEYVAFDVDEWITNATVNRVRIAIDEICKIYMEYKLSNNEPITAVSKEEMVAAAYAEGIVLSAKDRTELSSNIGIGFS